MARKKMTVLTEHQIAIAREVAHGRSDKTIAARLGLKDSTVKNQVSITLGKLRLSSRTQLAIYILQAGLVRLEDIELIHTSNEQTI